MTEIRTFNDGTHETLLEMAAHWQAIGRWGSRPSELAEAHIPDGVVFKNYSGTVVPPYACMRITGTEEIRPYNYLKIDKPNSLLGDPNLFIFNGQYEVPDGGLGTAQNGPVYHCFKNSGTVTAGEHWTPTSGQWYLTLSSGGLFSCFGDDDVADKVFRVVVNTCQLCWGKLDGDIAAGDTGTMTLWNIGTDTTTSKTRTVKNNGPTTIVNDDDVMGARRDELTGIWTVDIKFCSPE